MFFLNGRSMPKLPSFCKSDKRCLWRFWHLESLLKTREAVETTQAAGECQTWNINCTRQCSKRTWWIKGFLWLLLCQAYINLLSNHCVSKILVNFYLSYLSASSIPRIIVKFFFTRGQIFFCMSLLFRSILSKNWCTCILYNILI